MPRRSSRQRQPEPAKAVVGVILMIVFGWMFVPNLRPFIFGGGVLLVLGGVAWLSHRHNRKQAQIESGLLAPSSTPAPSPAAPISSAPRYVTRKSVLSKAEIAFHKVLLEAVPEAPIFPKMRVADVMDAAERWSGDFLRISQKHFDWVLCHPISFEPLIAIELDDSSHQWSDKQRKNDQVKDDAAREAGIALLRFPWQREYNVDQVRERLAAELDRIADAKDAAAFASSMKSDRAIASEVNASIAESIQQRRTKR